MKKTTRIYAMSADGAWFPYMGFRRGAGHWRGNFDFNLNHYQRNIEKYGMDKN